MKKLIKAILALPVAGLILLAWPLQVALFLPISLLARLGVRGFVKAQEPAEPVYQERAAENLVFDRRKDVSKIYGCNTRNVRFRWAIFLNSLQELLRAASPQPAFSALDFGAGSLRDTYELARMGFQVDALDKSENTLNRFGKAYCWESVPKVPSIFCGSFDRLQPGKKYDVVLAFDVLEHIYDLENCLNELKGRLSPGGRLLTTVPNRRALWERVFRAEYENRKRRNLPLDLSGVPHVQFRTPEEWRSYFQAQGFEIVDHDMAIGCLVNDFWAAAYGVPFRKVVEPVLRTAAKALGLKYPENRLETLFYPRWLVENVNALDQLLKPVLKGRWGWNLFVLSPKK